MFDVEKLISIFRKNNVKKDMDVVPSQTISIEINEKNYYISLVCDDNFELHVVLLDENNNKVSNILDVDGDRASIVKLRNKLYTFTDNLVFIHDINNLNLEPLKLYLGKLDLQSVCANRESIYAYSIGCDNIRKYDENLNEVEEYENYYSKGNLRVPLVLTCSDRTFFSIPIMVPNEDQYFLMKEFMAHHLGSEIAKQNDQIHSCSFNCSDNILYISMYNIVLMIKDGVDFSYLYFKNSAITTTYYDNDINKLIINFGGIKGNHVCGSILKLNQEEIKKNAIPLANISSKFNYNEGPIDGVINNNYNIEMNKKK